LFRILLVDDDPGIRKVVERALAFDPELTIRGCGSGEETLRQAAEWQPSLILLDMMMPDMDGPQTLARLRASPAAADIPVVFLTGQSASPSPEELARSGASGAIAKPFRLAALREAVHGYLRNGGTAAPPEDGLATASADEREEFRARLRLDGEKLIALRRQLRSGGDVAALRELRTLVHNLAGAGSLFGFERLSSTASALEISIAAGDRGHGALDGVEAGLDALVDGIEHA
jgi:CheY-like chemotaxis protein/HPt (histidine-containing phosphotransfer) domain-containing protein